MTVARSDYGHYLPLLRRIAETDSLRLHLIVAGAHLSPEFGETVAVIEDDGFEVADRIEMLLSSDTPQGIAKSMGLGVLGFAESFARTRPDILVVLGDRFEMHAAALAALPFTIPVAHIHGGEITRGAIDDALRHSITKLSHLHFVAAEEYGRRVIQLGEEPWRVLVTGGIGLDNVRSIPLLDRGELEALVGLSLDEPPLLVTFHPVTLEFEDAERQTGELLAALAAAGPSAVFTAPNADTGGRSVRRLIEEFVQSTPRAVLVENLGTRAYFTLMSVAAAMVGNSSSGIIEAPSFELPVVNVGARQEGRVRAANVIDVGYGREEILGGIRRALDPTFRRSLRGLANPYDAGGAAELIVDRLASVELDGALVAKRFHDLEQGP
ncbi:MAG TPA: UDP-N-acetylglucosamine 2-epimerase [Gaiellaceae bacterium]|nr:UDP-N-acetylglucosamine 2-epimerase [Gaiellaceae bacterium]